MLAYFTGGSSTPSSSSLNRNKNNTSLSIIGPHTWNKMGSEGGGGTVQGKKYTTKECFCKAIELEPNRAAYWSNLAMNGGGVIHGVEYSVKDCCVRALELDIFHLPPWHLLTQFEESTVINGKEYTRADSFVQCLELADGTEKAEAVAVAWCSLGALGGAIVSGKPISPKECFCKSLEIDESALDPWMGLARRGGGEVHGTHYSELDCYLICLNMDDESGDYWRNVGLLGGGEVKGVVKSPRQCFAKAIKFAATPEEESVAWLLLGSFALGGRVRGQKFDCEACFTQSVETNPLNTESWFNLGAACGGATINGIRYSSKECFIQIIEIDGGAFTSPLFWTYLALTGGCDVMGVKFSALRCWLNVWRDAEDRSYAERNLCRSDNRSILWDKATKSFVVEDTKKKK